MKKLTTLLAAAIVAVALCAMAPLTAFADDEQTASDIVASGTNTTKITWELSSDGTMTLTPNDGAASTGAVNMGLWYTSDGSFYNDGSDSSTGAFPYADDVKRVVVGEGITKVSNFKGFRNMTEISLPSTVTSFRDEAFFDCESLKSLTVPDGFSFAPRVIVINSGCTSFETLSINCAQRSYQYYLFDNSMKDPKLISYRHNLVKVGFQPVVIADDGTSADGHYAGLQCPSCKKFFTDETGTVDCTAEKTIPRLGVVGFPEEFREGTSQTVGVAYYTGQAIKPEMFVHVNGGADLDSKFYDIVMPENMVDIGTYDITINLHGNYEGQLHRTFSIVGDMNDIEVKYLDGIEMELDAPTGIVCPVLTYCGQRPTRDMFIEYVKDSAGNIIPEDQWELTVSGEMATMEGTPYYTYIKAASGSNYRGTNKDHRLIVKKLDITDPKLVSWPEFNHPVLCDPEFEGDFPKPEIEGTILSTGRPLVAGDDINVRYRQNDDGTMGYADVSVKQSLNLLVRIPGVTDLTLEYPMVKRASLANLDVSVPNCTFAGKACEPEVKIAVPGHEGMFYQEGVDYTVEYTNNDQVGTATAVVTAIENEDLSNLLTGSVEVPFAITPKNLSECSVSAANCTFTGKACKPQVKVAIPGDEGKLFQKDVDYTVTYKNNIQAGTATAVVTAIERADGSNPLAGSVEVPFTIAPLKLSACTVSVTSKLAYTGATQTPKVSVKTPNGTVVAATAYTVGKTSRATVGVTTFKITGKGNLTGSITKNVTILPKATSITRLAGSSKCFTVKWSKRTAQTSGYQVRYSLKKSMGSAKTKTISTTKTTSLKVSKLQAKKRYYIQVRTYKTVGKTKYYSAWSPVKSVVTK